MSATGEAGFTLLEMLVVVAIAALITGIGFPQLQRQVGAQEWRTATAATAALLRQGRAQALRGDRVAVVAAEPGGTALRLDGKPLALPRSVAAAVPLPITFYPDGSTSGGEVMVTAGRLAARIAVAPDTGLVMVAAP